MISRLFVGVDISKKWFDVCASYSEDAVGQRFANDPAGHAAFIASVSGLAKKIHVCMEHTGGFETPLALACKEAGHIVSLIDGRKFSEYRKSFGPAKAKTDRNDAKLLSRFCKERRPPEWFPVPDEYRTLRELVRHREALIKAKTAWSIRASYAVEEELVTIQRRTLADLLALQIKELDLRIRDHIKSFSNLQRAWDLLVSIPAIANISAVKILAETGPISNYPSARAYALAAGLNPIVCHSGQSTPPGRLPIYGNRELRAALYFPAVVSFGRHVGVWTFMDRLHSSGTKQKMTVIIAGMRKLAHIIFGVLKNNTEFDREKI